MKSVDAISLSLGTEKKDCLPATAEKDKSNNCNTIAEP